MRAAAMADQSDPGRTSATAPVRVELAPRVALDEQSGVSAHVGAHPLPRERETMQ